MTESATQIETPKVTKPRLFTKAAKNVTEQAARLPGKFELPIGNSHGNYEVSADGQFIVLTPYVGKSFALPLRNVQTYVETDRNPVNPLAAR